MFGTKKKTDQNQEKSTRVVAEKLEKMEIEQDTKSPKKTKDENWQPWNLARTLRITDEELGDWIQAYQQDLKSQAKDDLLQNLLGLLTKERS